MMQVGISIARTLTLDSNWQAFTASLSKNAPYIVSTVLWVYWYGPAEHGFCKWQSDYLIGSFKVWG